MDCISTFILANLIWLVFATLIIPLPAATAGLFAVLAPWVRGKDTELFGTFFSTLRRQWLKSTVIGAVDAVIGFVVVMNWRALGLMGLDNSILWLLMHSLTFLIALLTLMTNVYLWPLLVLFDLPLRRLVNVSVRLALAHPFWTVFVLFIALIPAVLALYLPAVLILLLVFSADALVINWGAWRIIRRYATPEELAELDAP